LEEEAAGDQAGDRDGEGKDVGDLVKGEEEDFSPRGAKSGKSSDLFQAHDEEDADECAHAQGEYLKIPAE